MFTGAVTTDERFKISFVLEALLILCALQEQNSE